MPTFYDTADSLGIIEDHIKAVLNLEDSQAKEMMKRYSSIRDQLVKNLSRLPQDRFTAQHLRGTLAQVDGAIKAMNSHLAGATYQASYQAAMSGVQDLLDEVKAFDKHFLGAVTPINLNTALVAHNTSQYLVTKYKTNLDAYGSGLMAQISNGLFSASIGQTNYGEVVGRIGNFFDAEQWKLHRIVRTEMHNIYNVGKLNGMRELKTTLPDMMKTLMHPMDQRTGADSKYAARLGLVAEVDEPFEYPWRGDERVFMAPPDRPNDRAILVPYRQEWGKRGKGAFIPGTFPKA